MKKLISLMLIGLILNSVFYVSSASGEVVPNESIKEAKMTAKLKNELTKIGIGKESKVEVKLNDGTKISGYLSELNEEDFVVVDSNDDSKRIRYGNVRKAKGRYKHHRFALTTSILGAVLGVLLIALSSNSDNNY